MEARVTMNGGMLVQAITAPLNRPNTRPESTPIVRPTISGMPPQTTAPAAKQPDMAMMEPTDRSMPPRMMTMVMPQASIRFVELWRSRLNRLVLVGKVFAVAGQTHRNRIMAASAIRMPRLSFR